MTPRDRDEHGRARNARPRDRLGRPLPHGEPGFPVLADDLEISLDEAVPLAQRFLDRRLPFHAHDVLENAWKQAPEEERELWHGLAQLAVGLTHAYRGNPAGARTLLGRARRRLAASAGARPRGLDVDGLLGWCDDLLGRLTADPTRAVSTEDLVDLLPVPQLQVSRPSEGGSAVCWLEQVCAECGRLDEPPGPRCSRCGAVRGAGPAGAQR